MFYDGVVKEIA